MEKGSTFFLKLALCLIGITILALSIFWLPSLANYTANEFPEVAFLRNPVLIGIYVTVIPFFIALYKSFRILHYIDHNGAFSSLSVKALKTIKQCALVISMIYVIGCLFLFIQNALHPGIALIGLIIIFASITIAVFSAVLQKLLHDAIEIKSENELTV